MRNTIKLAALAVCLTLLLGAATAQAAAPPVLEATSVSAVGETGATLTAKVDPEGAKTSVYHFEYVDLASFQSGGFAAAESTPDGASLPPGFEAKTFSARIEGLEPATAYRFRAIAENIGHQRTEGPVVSFTTLSAPQLFGPCPDEAFRSGLYAPPGHPSASLPDCRSYEQASPVEKNGNDMLGIQPLAKAADDGSAVSFGSTFGIPGGEGAQELPLYLASRGEGEAGWGTSGLLPPGAAGEEAQLMGWLPDFSAAYARADRLGPPRTEALFELRPGGPATRITPYVEPASNFNSTFTYAGASADESEVVLEATARLPEEEGGSLLPGSREGAPNVYLRDRTSGRLVLVSQLNSEAETAAALPKGAFAGPYDWARGDTGTGGAGSRDGNSNYVQEERAISADGSVYFTAAGTGRLYRRLNPTMPQSDPGPGGYVEGGHCAEPAKACTVQVSASEKDNSETSPDGTDPAGPQPAAFQAASADGSTAFFTSAEKLTNDADTGPEQALAAIGRLKAEDGRPPAEENSDLLSAHALGIAVSPDGRFLYWADPSSGEIMRSDAGGGGAVPLLTPGPTGCEVVAEPVPGHTEKVPASAPSTPRYVAVDAGHLYWTNTGPRAKVEDERPENGCGTIGRARIDPVTGEAEDPEPEWITGASNPEGIAVNSEHVYWANGAVLARSGPRSIGRASIGGGDADQVFFDAGNDPPRGVALDATHVYFSSDNPENRWSFVSRIPLDGGEETRLWLRSQNSTAGIRGIALIGEDVYWATEGEEAIGRAPVSDLKLKCLEFPDCENEYLPMSGKPFGLAADSSGHLYWSVNGEAPSNPGADLYRWSAAPDAEGHHLEDITADPTGDGAEVQGVIGASADGTRLYFVANGVLASGAQQGDCNTNAAHGRLSNTNGECNLYVWREDPETGTATTSFIARLKADGGPQASDILDWVPTPSELFGTAAWSPKTAALSEDGRTLLFASQRRLTAYDNKGTRELYRYHEGSPLSCISCNPSGAAPEEAPQLGTRMTFPGLSLRLGAAAVATRFLSADGERAFFETPEALVGADRDTNSDVYEWEAPGKGNCEEGSPAFVAEDGGCLYLLSPGEDQGESLFVDASTTGDDAFILTRAPLVGQDHDQLFDAYDARVGGGLAAQNPLPAEVCEGEACKGAAGEAPPPPSAASAHFQGPGDPPPARSCPKAKRAVRRHGKTICVPRHRRHSHNRRHRHNGRPHR